MVCLYFIQGWAKSYGRNWCALYCKYNLEVVLHLFVSCMMPLPVSLLYLWPVVEAHCVCSVFVFCFALARLSLSIWEACSPYSSPWMRSLMPVIHWKSIGNSIEGMYSDCTLMPVVTHWKSIYYMNCIFSVCNNNNNNNSHELYFHAIENLAEGKSLY